MAGDLETSPFAIKDCALLAIATGKRAQNLRELREHLRTIDLGSIYYHFWGGLLRPRFDDPEYHNDFAIWVAHSLHNKALAERLAVIDPVVYESLEAVRNELIEIIEETLDETEFPIWAKRDDQFEFIRHQIVVFDTQLAANTPKTSPPFCPVFLWGAYSIIWWMPEGGMETTWTISKTGSAPNACQIPVSRQFDPL